MQDGGFLSWFPATAGVIKHIWLCFNRLVILICWELLSAESYTEAPLRRKCEIFKTINSHDCKNYENKAPVEDIPLKSTTEIISDPGLMPQSIVIL